eukprot:4144584-Amphidinium_carterae.1
MTDNLNNLAVHQDFTSGYSPQSSGAAEANVRIIKQVLHQRHDVRGLYVKRGFKCGMTPWDGLPLIPRYEMSTWDGLAFIPKFGNDNLGWAATDPKLWNDNLGWAATVE